MALPSLAQYTGGAMTDPRTAITGLIHRYAELIDAGDLEGVARLFAAATFRSARGPVRRGTDELLTVLRRLVMRYEDGTPRTKHLVTNLSIEVDEIAGTATARSYFTVLQATQGLPLQIVVAGRYEDRFARVGRGWQFSDRLVHMDLVGDVSHHLRQDGGTR
jgi:3-phenylpropionate/cinnamic acid dioxygenase small subunit